MLISLSALASTTGLTRSKARKTPYNEGCSHLFLALITKLGKAHRRGRAMEHKVCFEVKGEEQRSITKLISAVFSLDNQVRQGAPQRAGDGVLAYVKVGHEEQRSITKISKVKKMKKFVCSVCGYVHEGDSAPEKCPQCKVPAEKFNEVIEGEMSWAAEHVLGVAKGAPAEIIEGLRANFMGECTEVGMYLAMARVAHREGYPEIGLYWEKAAWEEAEHAAKFAELLGEVVTDSTQRNLELRVEAENGATQGKFDLAKMAKLYDLDAIHDTVHEMARDEARHGKAFEGLLKRYFNK